VHLVIDWARSPSLTVDPAPGEAVRLECWPKYPLWRARAAMDDPDHWIALTRLDNTGAEQGSFANRFAKPS
jgi:hypothetical protein